MLITATSSHVWENPTRHGERNDSWGRNWIREKGMKEINGQGEGGGRRRLRKQFNEKREE
jgi:hypothetical protein